jgi:Raf kinase inhibitor-like YbhB/YbcL family protein
VSIVLALLLWSATFSNGATVPRAMVAVPCGGRNVSPQLSWSRLPAGTRSLALIVHDPDAPAPGGYYHWSAYNIPPSQHAVAQGRGFGARYDGRNDTGALGYFGPCPPPGKTHHYHFTLYALDVRTISTGAPLSARELAARIRGHVLAQATLIGLWRTKR